MVRLSELSVCMSKLDRRNQQLCWYDNRVYLCTKVKDIARKIQRECKRCKLKCYYFRSGGARIRHRIVVINPKSNPTNPAPSVWRVESGVIPRGVHAPRTRKGRLTLR